MVSAVECRRTPGQPCGGGAQGELLVDGEVGVGCQVSSVMAGSGGVGRQVTSGDGATGGRELVIAVGDFGVGGFEGGVGLGAARVRDRPVQPGSRVGGVPRRRCRRPRRPGRRGVHVADVAGRLDGIQAVLARDVQGARMDPFGRVGAGRDGRDWLRRDHIAAASWERAELAVHTNTTRFAASSAGVKIAPGRPVRAAHRYGAGRPRTGAGRPARRPRGPSDGGRADWTASPAPAPARPARRHRGQGVHDREPRRVAERRMHRARPPGHSLSIH